MVLMPRRPARARIAAWLLLASLAPGAADPAAAIHYAPIENLEHVDVALIDRADHEIGMAAYVLTDWPVMQALTRAADRGVKVRIYLDGTQLAEREPAKVFNDLAETPGVEIRIKHKAHDPMHLNGTPWAALRRLASGQVWPPTHIFTHECERQCNVSEIRKLISRWHRDERGAERKAARRKCPKSLAPILDIIPQERGVDASRECPA